MRNDIEAKYASCKELMKITGLGKNKVIELGTLAKAKIKFGRRTLYDIEKVYAYLETLTADK